MRPPGARRKPVLDKHLSAARLRLALASKGWKAAELARRLGVSRQLAASWARGRATPTGPTAARLPALLGVAADWLFPTGARAPQGIPEPGARAGPVRIQEGELAAPVLPQFHPGHWLELLKTLPPATQRQLVVTALEHGFDRLELHGSGLLRVALAMCTELRRLGYPAIADEIAAEIGQAVMVAGAAEANELPKEGQ